MKSSANPIENMAMDMALIASPVQVIITLIKSGRK
jgi:hypothetical protein